MAVDPRTLLPRHKTDSERARALVFCHLAEAWDDLLHDSDKVMALYRAARACDAENRFAIEGLKALCRRVKGWRVAAAR